MYIDSHNNVSDIRGQVQGPTDMLTREEQFLIVSMNSPPRPDLSGLWSQYSQAIVHAKRLKSTTVKTKMGVVDVHGNEDNSINPKESVIDEATEFSLLSVHINSMGLMILMLLLVCIFRYLKLAHLKGCWLKMKCCRRKTILINSDGTLSYIQKSQRNSIVSGHLPAGNTPGIKTYQTQPGARVQSQFSK